YLKQELREMGEDGEIIFETGNDDDDDDFEYEYEEEDFDEK
ncbi:MAG: GTPase ObgE, partial [Bacteroides sp.]|nr:GTPase ObgE [Bacteroides sp.]